MGKRFVSRVSIPELDEALQQVLETYAHDVMEAVDAASWRAADRLREITKATAPVGYRKKFRRGLSVQEIY